MFITYVNYSELDFQLSSNTFTFTEFTDEDCINVTASPDQRLENPESFSLALGRQTGQPITIDGTNDTVLVTVMDATTGGMLVTSDVTSNNGTELVKHPQCLI